MSLEIEFPASLDSSDSFGIGETCLLSSRCLTEVIQTNDNQVLCLEESLPIVLHKYNTTGQSPYKGASPEFSKLRVISTFALLWRLSDLTFRVLQPMFSRVPYSRLITILQQPLDPRRSNEPCFWLH